MLKYSRVGHSEWEEDGFRFQKPAIPRLAGGSAFNDASFLVTLKLRSGAPHARK